MAPGHVRRWPKSPSLAVALISLAEAMRLTHFLSLEATAIGTTHDTPRIQAASGNEFLIMGIDNISCSCWVHIPVRRP
ncbi:hypothetical protein BKA82DRAFT_999438 [Pisolithus tinctorius]|uniref:Secreted protein n=1 Tax=Pisolithus tinctorius Marx 270 TaxID=870435 RepID=A0A0C3JAX6_PISTI|nr:hypothetical protein BKA82DRAFT_999438 [Pisolithus tinctorius]KIO06223.1 hypothetical protein M404DRAFT_999438 [Pisolithus tinctorius Marx 270]